MVCCKVREVEPAAETAFCGALEIFRFATVVTFFAVLVTLAGAVVTVLEAVPVGSWLTA